MRNIGPVSRAWLAEIEIHSIDDLRRVGAPRAYRMIRANKQRVSLNLLWALQGALLDMDCRDLSPEDKAALKQQAQSS